MRIYLTLIMSLLFISCADSSNDYEESLSKQGEINAYEQLKAEDEQLARKAKVMEADLNKRKHFIQAISGEFFGELEVEGIDFSVNVEIVSTIPIEFPSRIRILDEINYEIENLAINIKIKMENPRVSNSAVSCHIEGHRPDINEGLINIISNECRNIFKFSLTESLIVINSTEAKKVSKIIAKEIISGAIVYVDFLDGVFESSVSSKKYTFKLRR